MFRFSMVAYVITTFNFPGRRLQLWFKHVPCESFECEICNPFVDASGRLQL